MKSVTLQSLKFITVDVLGDIAFFPLWWYTRGMKRYALMLWGSMLMVEHQLGVVIWIKNIMRPMYGQMDWQGRIISFFMRVMNIIFRGFVLIMWSVISGVLFIFWIVFPLVIIWMIGLQLGISFYTF